MAEKEKSKPSPRKITVLRQLRERAGLSREQLVARLDNRISLRTLQRWENLGNEPAMTRIDWLNLCEALNVQWEDLPVSLSGFVEAEQSDLIAV
jgi:transcriptional regulator with XRE-family HTH domain